MTTADKLRRAIERKFGKFSQSKFGELSQAKVAQRLEIPAGTLSEYLTGKYEPTLGSLRGIAEHLDCSLTSLVGDEAA